MQGGLTSSFNQSLLQRPYFQISPCSEVQVALDWGTDDRSTDPGCSSPPSHAAAPSAEWPGSGQCKLAQTALVQVQWV